MTFNLRLESVQLLCSFVDILLVGLELGVVSELNIAKPAVGLCLNVSLSGVEPERVVTDELEVAQLTGIFQHLLLDPLRHQAPLLLVVFLHVGAQIERLLERLIAKLALDGPHPDLGVGGGGHELFLQFLMDVAFVEVQGAGRQKLFTTVTLVNQSIFSDFCLKSPEFILMDCISMPIKLERILEVNVTELAD